MITDKEQEKMTQNYSLYSLHKVWSARYLVCKMSPLGPLQTVHAPLVCLVCLWIIPNQRQACSQTHIRVWNLKRPVHKFLQTFLFGCLEVLRPCQHYLGHFWRRCCHFCRTFTLIWNDISSPTAQTNNTVYMQGLSNSHYFVWTGLDLLKQFTSTHVWSLQPNLFLQAPMEEDKYHYLMSYIICYFFTCAALLELSRGYFIYASFCNKPISQDRVFLFIPLW